MPKCDTCGQVWPMPLLDAKPRFLRRRRLTALMPIGLFNWLMRRAAARDMVFDHCEGPCCYGPGFTPQAARDWEDSHLESFIHMRAPDLSEEAEAALKTALDKAVLDGAVHGIGRAVDKMTGFDGEAIDRGDIGGRQQGKAIVDPIFSPPRPGFASPADSAVNPPYIWQPPREMVPGDIWEIGGKGRFGIPSVCAIKIESSPGVGPSSWDGPGDGPIIIGIDVAKPGSEGTGCYAWPAANGDVTADMTNITYAIMTERNEAQERVEEVRTALSLLRRARDCLVASGASPKALERVRKAIASTDGAHRHAQGLADRLRAQEGQSDVE
jgi:hypothetical protein